MERLLHNDQLRKINAQSEIDPKGGNHALRRTCLSNMAASGLLSGKEIQDFAGHKEFAVTQKYYLYATQELKQRQSVYDIAIGRHEKS